MYARTTALCTGLLALALAVSTPVGLAEGTAWEDTGYTAELAWADWVEEEYLAFGFGGSLTSWAQPAGQPPFLLLDLGARAELMLGTGGTRFGLFAELDAPRRLDAPGDLPGDSLTVGTSLGAWLFDFPDIRPYIGGLVLLSLQPAPPRWNGQNLYNLGGGVTGGIAARTEDLTLRLDSMLLWALPGELYLGPQGPQLTPVDALVTVSDLSGTLYVERWYAQLEFVTASVEDATGAELWRDLSWDSSLTYAIGWGFTAGGGLAHSQETTYWKLLSTYARRAGVQVQGAYLQPLPLWQEGLQPEEHWLLQLSILVRLHL